MGFSSIATRAIFMVAMVIMVGTTLDTYFEVMPEARAKREIGIELARERALTNLNATWCYAGTRVSVTALNDGPETLDALNSSIVVDGVVYTDFTPLIDMRSGTSVWAPGSNATYNRTGFASTPTDVMLVTRAGVEHFPYKVACTVNVHISAMATYKAGVASSSFQRGTDTVEVRVTVVDDGDVPFAGATVDIDWLKPNTNLDHASSAITDATGIASSTWAIPEGANQGTWTARVTSISGPGVFYDSAANVLNSVTFDVTN